MFTAQQPKPISVALIQVLLWIDALLNIFTGGMYLANANDLTVQAETGMTSGELTGAGWVLIFAGLLFAWIAHDLGKGVGAARWIISVVITIQLIAAVWIAIGQDGSARNDQAGQFLLGIVILLLLHTTAADRFFSQHRGY